MKRRKWNGPTLAPFVLVTCTCTASQQNCRSKCAIPVLRQIVSRVVSSMEQPPVTDTILLKQSAPRSVTYIVNNDYAHTLHHLRHSGMFSYWVSNKAFIHVTTRSGALFAQCATLSTAGRKCQSRVLSSKNLSTNLFCCLQRLTVSYKDEISLNFVLPNL